MLRQSILYLLLSILMVLFAKYSDLFIIYIDLLFTQINLLLDPFFGQDHWGWIIRKILMLMLIPIIITGIPALIYRGVKGRPMPHFIAIVWVFWTILALSDILMPR